MNKNTTKPRFSIAALFAWVAIVSILLALFVSFYPFGPLVAWLAAAGMIIAANRKYRNERPVAPSNGFAIWMIVVGLLALPFFTMEGHCVPPYRLERVEAGFSRSEVIKKLGKPSDVASLPGGGEEWCYSGFTWCIVRIKFDQDGSVEKVSHDH